MVLSVLWAFGFSGVGADDTFILSRVWAQKQRVNNDKMMLIWTKAEGKHLNNDEMAVLIFKLGTKAEGKQC